MIRDLLWTIIPLSLVNAVFCATRERDPFSFPTLGQPLSPMKTIFLSIHYAKAKFIGDILNNKKFTLLSKNDYALSDNRTNQILIWDEKSHIRSIQSFIKHLNIPIDQILIKT
ncbi:hypothetical protein [Candidatus Coxiella mudrowiae]|uniref:hypothetical protein n=1 Tax=Candidatus Coxiella mudrowiae TaxID=2054173 RepID=UPI0009E401B3|nr:hypothetical protein [Candidatus Coxiella mudrowiae]